MFISSVFVTDLSDPGVPRLCTICLASLETGARCLMGWWNEGDEGGEERSMLFFSLFLFSLLFASSSEPYKVPSMCRRPAVEKGSDCIRLNQSVELNRCITEFSTTGFIDLLQLYCP